MPTAAGRFVSPRPHGGPSSATLTSSATRRSASANARRPQPLPQAAGVSAAAPAKRERCPSCGGLFEELVHHFPQCFAHHKLATTSRRGKQLPTIAVGGNMNTSGGSAAAVARNGSPIARAKDDWMRSELKRLEKINRERLQAHVDGLRSRQSPIIIPTSSSENPTPTSSSMGDEPMINYDLRIRAVPPARMEDLPKRSDINQQQHQHMDPIPPSSRSATPTLACSISPPRPAPPLEQVQVPNDVLPSTPKHHLDASQVTPQQFRIKWTPIGSAGRSGNSPMSLVSLEATTVPVLGKPQRAAPVASRLGNETDERQNRPPLAMRPAAAGQTPTGQQTTRPAAACAAGHSASKQLVTDELSPESPPVLSRRSATAPRSEESTAVETSKVVPSSSTTDDIPSSNDTPPAAATTSCSRPASPVANGGGAENSLGISGLAAVPKFCWQCGCRHPQTVVVKFCVECGAKVAVH